jgi:large subunit ribosomal protein L29
MNYETLSGMSDEQLALTLLDTEKHLFKLRFQSATDRLETPSEIRKAKREIARVKTVQRERELKRLAELPDAEIAKQLETLGGMTDSPGKRRIKRGLHRLQTIQAGRTTTKGDR